MEELNITGLLADLLANKIKFSDVLLFIERYYEYTPAAFKNGSLENAAHENQGSAKIFSFAHQNGLSTEDTLSLFAEHYEAVRADPAGSSHQNIRQFSKTGWEGISFDGQVLKRR